MATRINLLGINPGISEKEIQEAFKKKFDIDSYKYTIERASTRRVQMVGEFSNFDEDDLKSWLMDHRWSDGSKCSGKAK